MKYNNRNRSEGLLREKERRSNINVFITDNDQAVQKTYTDNDLEENVYTG